MSVSRDIVTYLHYLHCTYLTNFGKKKIACLAIFGEWQLNLVCLYKSIYSGMSLTILTQFSWWIFCLTYFFTILWECFTLRQENWSCARPAVFVRTVFYVLHDLYMYHRHMNSLYYCRQGQFIEIPQYMFYREIVV